VRSGEVRIRLWDLVKRIYQILKSDSVYIGFWNLILFELVWWVTRWPNSVKDEILWSGYKIMKFVKCIRFWNSVLCNRKSDIKIQFCLIYFGWSPDSKIRLTFLDSGSRINFEIRREKINYEIRCLWPKTS